MASSPVLDPIFLTSTRRRAPTPPPSQPPQKRARQSPLSDAELYLDEVKEEFSSAAYRAPIGCHEETEVPADRWASWDYAMDIEWNRFVTNIQAAGLGDDLVPELSKPSGPRDALLCCLWHYPTYSTTRRFYGQTLDPSNSCLGVQCDKILDHTNVRTQDTYPMRIEYDRKSDTPQYQKMFGDTTEKILETCEGFALEAVKSSAFTICLGKQNSILLRRELQKAEGLYLEEYRIRIPLSMYQRQVSCLVARDHGGTIRNVVFFSYHGMYFTHLVKSTKEMLFLHDLIWNGVCEWSRVPVATHRHFSNFGKELHRLNPLDIAIHHLVMEQQTGTITPHEEAIAMLQTYLEKEGLLDTIRGLDETQSVIKTVHTYMSAKGKQAMSEPGWKETKGKEAAAKRAETISDPLWKETKGKERSAKLSQTINNPLYKETKGKEAAAKISKTKSDPLYKATKGKETGAKISQIKNDPLWKETKGKEAAAKRSQTKSDPLYKATKGKETGAKISQAKNDPIYKETKAKELAAKRAETWSGFYNNAEVQAFLRTPMNELSWHERQKQENIQLLGNSTDATEAIVTARADVAKRYSVKEGGITLVMPGLKILKPADKAALIAKAKEQEAQQQESGE
ncbi:hypothetical protein T069G_02489 [Trichoderma breve]|uniref:Uncharacterized protein n=1 Tax=Trichoderma breve TaxID=2034170 RepID=A0A9W9BE83_9HYPO|nr:hypothetical protein T069G_02489 [Trichoderma breve]KAJ4861535.1 hypothetical protein T069G_02489 [Trichoderma breve]